ncbi:MAG: hypothetical protein R3Y39_04290 [Rikenellaceae bacterium]
MRLLKSILVAVLALAVCSSCGLSKIAQQVEVEGFSKLDLKGMTGLQAAARVTNDSRYDIQMSEAEVTLYHNAKRAVTLTQVGEAISTAETRADVETLWKISGVDPRSISSFVSLLSDRELENMTISYSAKFSVKGLNKRISQENVELQKFMAIFAR